MWPDGGLQKNAFVALLEVALLFLQAGTIVGQNSIMDLPSCERAHCMHCHVPFIARVCPMACSRCFQTSPSRANAAQTNVNVQYYASPTQTMNAPPPATVYRQPQRQPWTDTNYNGPPYSYYQPPALPYAQSPRLQTFMPPPQPSYLPTHPGFATYPNYPEQRTASSFSTAPSLANLFTPFTTLLPPSSHTPLVSYLPPSSAPYGHPVTYSRPAISTFNGQVPYSNETSFVPSPRVPTKKNHHKRPSVHRERTPSTHAKTNHHRKNTTSNQHKRPPYPRPTVAQPPSPLNEFQQQRPIAAKAARPSIDGPVRTVTKNIVEEKYPAATAGIACPRQPNWEPCIPKDLANERYRNCCQRLGDGCVALCNYDATLTTIQLAVLTGRCPLSKVADVMICASGHEDATSCCEAYGVFEPGYQHCRPYCNPAAGLPQNGMLTEQYKCLGKLSQIQRCFYVTQRPS